MALEFPFLFILLWLTSFVELAHSILRTLRTSTVAKVVDRLTPILHMDPVLKLPPEITAEIFSYLDPPTLLTASLASRAWRERILDSRLWRQLYIREGWHIDIDAVRRFEQLHSELSTQNRKPRSRHADFDVPEPQLKRRVTAAGRARPSTPPWNEQHDMIEADLPASPPDAEGDRKMHDVFADGSTSPTRERRPATGSSVSAQIKSSSLLIRAPNGSVKLNWPHLYKQRRRLESNWERGRYVNFQLPHPDHLEEMHQECVYAIQFSGRWLVSGSRDRSIRVWDLERRRLWYRPLYGHKKSVLCLQFDPSPEEDIIISGSSDRSVIVWRFSTGEKLHELVDAHDDSVLNLRFDRRYLVTCSKDKRIKVWNRQVLTPLDPDYPTVSKDPRVRYPEYIIDTSEVAPSVLEAQLASRQIQPLEPYSLLMTLEGHGAAVNAIQISDDEIVSASGDRLIKVWSLRSGVCLKTIVGHTKGIACVQFDSRRIVSGSNDDSVRIFDHATGAEVGYLKGHSNLVRTVQAAFGDPPGVEEVLRLEAMAVDHDYWEARRQGKLPEIQHIGGRGRPVLPRNAGSRNPHDLTALGASIPPGGGGSRWGRIVSGSYDETIIVWRKDREGKWVIGQRYRQEDAALSASATAAAARRGNTTRLPTTTRMVNRAAALSLQPPSTSGAPLVGDQNTTTNPSAEPSSSSSSPPNNGTPNPTLLLQQQQEQHPLLHHHHHHHHHRHHHHHHSPLPQPQPQPPSAPAPGMNPFPNLPPNIMEHIHPTSRIYKLQFDARMIVCSSQDPRIVGWDFACDDPEIIEACQFFGEL